MISIIFWLLTLPFMIKVIWNFGVPYDLVIRAYKREFEGQRSSGISLMPSLEVLLLIPIVAFCVIFSAPLTVEQVAIGGLILIVVSYVHLFIVAMALGWLVYLIKQKQAANNSDGQHLN